jgi:hypothetical protein
MTSKVSLYAKIAIALTLTLFTSGALVRNFAVMIAGGMTFVVVALTLATMNRVRSRQEQSSVLTPEQWFWKDSLEYLRMLGINPRSGQYLRECFLDLPDGTEYVEHSFDPFAYIDRNDTRVCMMFNEGGKIRAIPMPARG